MNLVTNCKNGFAQLTGGGTHSLYINSIQNSAHTLTFCGQSFFRSYLAHTIATYSHIVAVYSTNVCLHQKIPEKQR